MRIIAIHDKLVIETFARRNPYLFLYELGDLDDFFWPYTVWYGLEDGGEIIELALFYTDVEPPVVLAHTMTSAETMGRLLQGLQRALPQKFFSHLDSNGVTALGGAHVHSHGAYFKMGLTDRARVASDRSAEGYKVQPLHVCDLDQIVAFYDQAYPGNWFVPRMLETGCFYGAIDSAGVLAAVAGIHVYSPLYKAAALGNIATLPGHRGRGLATAVTAALCAHLLARDIEHIGLNVRADNATAIRCYSGLGFSLIAEYGEYMVTQRAIDA